jgi:hypothetical protein
VVSVLILIVVANGLHARVKPKTIILVFVASLLCNSSKG